MYLTAIHRRKMAIEFQLSLQNYILQLNNVYMQKQSCKTISLKSIKINDTNCKYLIKKIGYKYLYVEGVGSYYKFLLLL